MINLILGIVASLSFAGLLAALMLPIGKRKPPVVRPTAPASRWPPVEM